MKNPYLVLGMVIVVFALLGGIPFFGMKTMRVRSMGLITMLLAVILGFCFIARGLYLHDLSTRDERRIEWEKTRRAQEETKAIETYQQTHPLNAPVSTNN